MAGGSDNVVVYYRNHNASDTTQEPVLNDLVARSVDRLGFSAPEGMEFSAWNTAQDASGISYAVGDTVTLSQNSSAELYAVWVVPVIPYIVTSEELTDVADAIRTKGGTSAALVWPSGYVDAIGAISGGSTGPVLNLINRSVSVSAGETFTHQYEFGELGAPNYVGLWSRYDTGTFAGDDLALPITSASFYSRRQIAPYERVASRTYVWSGVSARIFTNASASLTSSGLLTVSSQDYGTGSSLPCCVMPVFIWTSALPSEIQADLYLDDYGTCDPAKLYNSRIIDAFVTDNIFVDGQTDPCYLRGTLITLADGTKKPVEEVTYDDELLVWDFDEGRLSSAKPLWIKCAQRKVGYHHLTLESGKTLDVVGTNGKAHRLLDVDAEKFVWSTDMVGHRTMTIDGEDCLVSCEWREELCEYYNIVTKRHINLYANGILTSCRYNNIYPIRGMRFVKEPREVIPFDAYDVPREWYDGMRLSEQTIPIEDTNEYVRWRVNHSA